MRTTRSSPYIPARGDVVVSRLGQRYVVDHVERYSDEADRYALRSARWGVLLTGRYTLGDFRNGTLTPDGASMDLDTEASL